MKTHCKARINVSVSSDGTITISKVALEHNHDLVSPSKSRYFRCNKNIDPSIHTENELSKVMDRIENLKLEMACQESFSEITERDNLVQNHMIKIHKKE